MSNRLFVGQLPADITDQELRAHFSPFGNITDVHVPNSSKARKIAFITYDDVKCVYAALGSRDHGTIRDVQINMMQAEEKGAARGGPPAPAAASVAASGGNRIFVNNIPHCTSDELNVFFSSFATVTDVFYTSPKTYAFITFGVDQDMFKCLASGPFVFKGTELACEVAKPRPEAYQPTNSSRMSQPDNTRIFVGHLPDWDEGSIREYFGQYGVIKDIFCPKNAFSGGAKGGYCYITFNNVQEMWAALAVASHDWKGNVLRVQEAAPKGTTPDIVTAKREYRIFVGRIPTEVSDEDIRNHFCTCGEVTDVYRPKTQNPSREGFEFGFVIFSNAQAMAKALSLSSKAVNGHELTITRAKERISNTLSNNPLPAAQNMQNMQSMPNMSMYSNAMAYNPYMTQPMPSYPAAHTAQTGAMPYQLANYGYAAMPQHKSSSQSNRYHPYM